MESYHAPASEKLVRRTPWNKGKIVGAKPPLRPSHVWSIRTKLQMEDRKRDLALFDLAIDSKLRGCNVVAVRVDDVAPSGYAMDRATIRQRRTSRPVRFELTDQTRLAIDECAHERFDGRRAWKKQKGRTAEDAHRSSRRNEERTLEESLRRACEPAGRSSVTQCLMSFRLRRQDVDRSCRERSTSSRNAR